MVLKRIWLFVHFFVALFLFYLHIAFKIGFLTSFFVGLNLKKNRFPDLFTAEQYFFIKGEIIGRVDFI